MNQNRRTIKPYLIDGNDTTSLERVTLNLTKDQRALTDNKLFPETWLQELIERQPDILPINQIEPVFEAAVSISRETATSVGFIDNLLINPSGYLTIVETKLWRNSEARREVVGQIVDYAQELSTWSYDKLDDAVKAYTLKTEGAQRSLYTLISSQSEAPVDEMDFIDTVTENLNAGRFLLLIVGDGIRTEVESLSNFLNEKTGLHFTLGLVELQVYSLPESEKLFVLPQVVARTKEIVRYVVRTDQGKLIVSNTDPNSKTPTTTSNSKQPITSSEFFEKLQEKSGADAARAVEQLFADLENKGCQINWARMTGSVRLRSKLDPNITYNIVSVENSGSFYVGYLITPFKKAGLPKEIYERYVAATGSLFNRDVHDKDGYTDTWKGTAAVTQLPNNLQVFIRMIDELISGIRQAEDVILATVDNEQGPTV